MMPQARKHADNARRQAAYRQRTEQARMQQLRERSLPPLSPIPSMPAQARWATAITHVQHLLECMVQEMEQYHDDRSEAWQESERGQSFAERLEGFQELLSNLESLAD